MTTAQGGTQPRAGLTAEPSCPAANLRPRANGRADLLEWLLTMGCVPSEVATVFGYRAVESAEPWFAPPSGFPAAAAQESEGAAVTETPPLAREHYSREATLPHFPFWRASHAEALAPARAPVPPEHVLTREELLPGREPPPARIPLARWARLNPYLRHRLGAVGPGSLVDVPRLLRYLGQGRPLVEIPRLSRRAWAPQTVVIWDETQAMIPFQDDARDLYRRLRRERGRGGLRIVRMSGDPDRLDTSLFPPGAPVLALSPLGLHGREIWRQEAWLRLGDRLRRRNHPLQALVPCPRGEWTEEMSRRWPMALWDTHARFPRRGGLSRLFCSPPQPVPVEERLLDCLAAAPVVGPALLREARLNLGGDVGSEWKAWFHRDCRWGVDGFRLADHSLPARLKNRLDWGRAHPKAHRAMEQTLQRHLRDFSTPYQLQSTLLGLGSDQGVHPRWTRALDGLVGLLRQFAGGGREWRRQKDLVAWFIRWVDVLPEAVLSRTELREAFSRGLALAHHLTGHPVTTLPPGLDPAVYRLQLREAEQGLALTPLGYAVDWVESGLRIVPNLDPVGVGRHRLGSIWVDRPALHFDTTEGQHRLLRARFPPQPMPVLSPGAANAFTLRSHSQRLTFEHFTRPRWAERLVYDPYGLRAEFSIGGVLFVLRWIPPGRFLMGSPPDEPGRMDREGPQHERGD